MFDFFKRKKTEPPPPEPVTPANEPAEPQPGTPATDDTGASAPQNEERPAPPEEVEGEAALEPETPAAAEASLQSGAPGQALAESSWQADEPGRPAPEKRGWSDRLRAGLGFGPAEEPPAPESAPASAPPSTPETAPAAVEPAEPDRRSWSERLRAGLGRSREKLATALTTAFSRKALDDETLDELETALIMADVGVPATQHLLEDLRERYRRSGGAGEPKALLKAAILDLIAPLERPLVVSGARPFVIMIAGVNGAGKTTSIGKLAHYFQEQGFTVMLAAGDTFRAAAREQLVAWGERNGVPVISQAGGDPAAVVFDAVGAARARGIDLLLADTAGRLPTQLHLMDEIKKVRRVVGKADPTAPHETLLVLDANTGQNAVAQVKAFDEALGLTGLILTKLDGSAKGGTVCAIAKERPVPLRFIGVGEGIEDLRPFVAADFVDALID